MMGLAMAKHFSDQAAMVWIKIPSGPHTCHLSNGKIALQALDTFERITKMKWKVADISSVLFISEIVNKMDVCTKSGFGQDPPQNISVGISHEMRNECQTQVDSLQDETDDNQIESHISVSEQALV